MTTLKSYCCDNPLLKYTVDHSLRLTKVQKRLNQVTLEHPRCTMLGAPEVLQLNANLIQVIGGKKVLDVGVFTGASAVSAALALPPHGEVHALDISEELTNIGKPFWREAGVADKIHLHIGPASDSLQMLINKGHAGTFDFAFIDADKPGYDDYYEKCLVLLRRGGIISLDNTLWKGSVVDPNSHDEDTVAIRKFNEKLRDDQRINLSFLMIADGLTLCFIK